MATMPSAPASPDPVPSPRPQSMHATSPPEHVSRPRPHSMMMRPPRSSSRLSMASSRGGAVRALDEDGKTAVKVVVRVRPPLKPSDPGFDLIPQRFQRSTVQVPTPTTLSVESSQGRKIFTFDRVFGEETTQTGVWDYLADSVDSFLQGYNVSILAYGQSGAGKSYTMGTCGHDEQFHASARGIIPRAAIHLFEALTGAPGIHSRTNSGLKTPTRYSVGNISSVLQNRTQLFDRNWQIVVTYVEIYNEQPRDLLLPEGSTIHERAAVQIREDPKGRIFVEGLRSVAVNTVEELMGVLNYGSAIRQTDATAINSRSSRSHAVFTINLKQVKTSASSSPARVRPTENGIAAENTIMIDSKLHFVDLAGSERLKNTGATGDRAKEGISINAGLASLGKVISQLSSRSAGGYVSYRDSKLTRMLQDSLGGNAITYMVACVTPAEFHLSETLNTVQYAQRARNIQSKPQIQQVSEDSDKQAVIERLRSEVAFLRQQIRTSDVGDKKVDSLRERHMSTELEMHNQLLDVQEGYRNLGERHAKLVAELTNSAELVQESATEGAAERLKRSRENQRQIENIILEYEKTIQSLEANLSTTRSSLANTETTLLERETKFAYVETMNSQLNSRIHKLMERESSTESYLRELEARLEDTTSGSEKHEALVAELRKEMNRVRESETSAENYISTLEERLAEADQDMDIMQREVDRLEQLVDRQRSLGKLDNLLLELDQIQKKQIKMEQKLSDPETPQKTPITNGTHVRQKSELMEVISETKELDTKDEVATEEVDELQTPRPDPSTLNSIEASSKFGNAVSMWRQHLNPEDQDELKPAQTRFMVDKFETVTQELFDLRLEHESTIYDFDMLSAKYREALRTLAEMQDRFDDVQSSATQSLAHSDVEDGPSVDQSFEVEKRNRSMNRDLHSSTHSPSSELSSIGPSLPSAQITQSNSAAKGTQISDDDRDEIQRLQGVIAEHEKNMSDMQKRLSTLNEEHKGTLDTVEKLKMEAQRSSSPLPTAGSYSSIRRHTSQLGSAVDRGQRSVASLRGLIAEELEDKPERIETAEIHLTAATHELASRMSRIQSLEAELLNAKKEMDMKSTIISGLTRERNSLKTGSPVDLSMVSQMRDQLIQKETELKRMHESYSKQEQNMQVETAAARKQVEETNASHETTKKDLEQHKSQLNSSKSQLETALSTIETLRAEQLVRVKDQAEGAADQRSLKTETTKSTDSSTDTRHEEITKLRASLNKQIATNAAHAQKISELTQMHEDASKDIHEHSQIIQEKSAEIEKHKVQIAALQSRLQESESAVEFHKHGLKSLHEAHATEVEEMKLAHAGMMAGYDDQIAELKTAREAETSDGASELQQAKSTMQQILTGAKSAFGHETSEKMLVNHIQDLAEERKHVMETNKRLTSTNAELESQLADRASLREIEEERDAALLKNNNYQDTIRNLANEVGNHEESIRDKNKQIKRLEDQMKSMQAENEKKILLVEELEQQLQRSYEQHEKRISVIQLQGSQALTEAQQKISQLEKDLHGTLASDVDYNSRKPGRPQSPEDASSNLRKSASVASLPSPPPAIPLPPLPILTNITSASAGNPSPPQSRHTSKELPQPQSPNGLTKDLALIKRQSAIIDDQDSRLRTIEKHLHAEKQLTATLEEALVDLEKQSNKLRVDADSWKKKAWSLEEEMTQVRNDRHSERLSMHAVEEEIKKRRAAEDARAQLEERMKLLKQSMDGGKKKKKSTLNCF